MEQCFENSQFCGVIDPSIGIEQQQLLDFARLVFKFMSIEEDGLTQENHCYFHHHLSLDLEFQFNPTLAHIFPLEAMSLCYFSDAILFFILM